MPNCNEDVSSEISLFVIQILEKFLDAEHSQHNYTYEIQRATEKGDNYMGVVYRVVIIPLKDKCDKRSIILKVPPQNLQQRVQFFARAGFLRESLAYEEFLPLIKEFQKSKGLHENETFFEYPQVYFTSTEDFNETICMSDLQCEGFRMHDRFEPLSLDHVSYVVRVYAKLHATSLAIKAIDPDKINSLKYITDIFEQRKDDIQLNDYFESLKRNALESIHNPMERPYYEKLKQYFNTGSFYSLLLKLLDSRSSEPYAVICHGDCWVNNIMFKEQKGKVVDIRLIDWQIMRYSSPITDLMYFLMSSTTREFRQLHLKEILDIYYCETSKHIIRLGSDAEKVFPRHAFDREFEQKGAIGLLFSMIVLPMLTTKNEDIPDLEKLSEKVSAGQSTDAMEAGFKGANSTLFNNRMRGIIMDSIDWNFL